MRKRVVAVLLFGAALPLAAIGQHSKPRQPQGCVRGGIAYAAASYVDTIDVKRKYARRFDLLTKRPIQQLLCSTQLQGLPVQKVDSTGELVDHLIEQSYLEPLFINLSTLDGLYGIRHYGRISVWFRCGYSHRIVLIADKRMYTLGEDTAANKQSITKLLKSSFTSKEIEQMQREYKQNYYCSTFTFMPPEIIRRGVKLLFDAHTFR